MKRYNSLVSYCLAVVLTALPYFICPAPTAAQLTDKIPPPSEEEFQKVDAVATPWRDSSDCNLGAAAAEVNRYPNCKAMTGVQTHNAHRHIIYDDSGNVWYEFSFLEKEPDFYLKKPKEGFIPLSTNNEEIPIDLTVIMRMVGESEHWYEVEVNENTRETKFLRKDIPTMWAKVSWLHWLEKGRHLGPVSGDNRLKVGKENRELLKDRPNGKPIETGEYKTDTVWFLKMDGDWAYVRMGTLEPKIIRGWIRWRDGREFLVGCAYNNFKVPSPKPKSDNDQAFFSKP